jgi:hypothetical protein
VDDCVEGTKWTAAHARELNADASNLMSDLSSDFSAAQYFHRHFGC